MPITHQDTKRLDRFEANVNFLRTIWHTDMTGEVTCYLELSAIDTGGNKTVYPTPENNEATLRDYIDCAMQSEQPLSE